MQIEISFEWLFKYVYIIYFIKTWYIIPKRYFD